MLSRRVLPQTSVILLMLTGPLSTLDIPLALFTFNLGVEAGQLMVVAAVLLSFKAVKAVYKVPPLRPGAWSPPTASEQSRRSGSSRA